MTIVAVASKIDKALAQQLSKSMFQTVACHLQLLSCTIVVHSACDELACPWLQVS